MENLKNELIEKGYKEGNNCYYKTVDGDSFYFNMDDEGNFTTVTYAPKSFGGQEFIICEKANIDILDEVEENFKVIELRDFISDFIFGIDCKLCYTNETTVYVDQELAEELNMETKDLDDDLLKNVMEEIVKELEKRNGINAYISSSNEITAYKVEV